MNPGLIQKASRWVLTTFGGILIGWAASRGYQWGDIITNLLSSDAAVGVVTVAITAIWAWASSRLPAVAKLVDAFAKDPASPVKGLVVAPTQEGVQLANQVDTTVVAGTPAATQVAERN